MCVNVRVCQCWCVGVGVCMRVRACVCTRARVHVFVWLLVKSIFPEHLISEQRHHPVKKVHHLSGFLGRRDPALVSRCVSLLLSRSPAGAASITLLLRLHAQAVREAGRRWFKPRHGPLSLGTGLLRVSHAHPSLVVIGEILELRHSFEELTADQRDAYTSATHGHGRGSM